MPSSEMPLSVPPSGSSSTPPEAGVPPMLKLE
jgi:hypothetical protein